MPDVGVGAVVAFRIDGRQDGQQTLTSFHWRIEAITDTTVDLGDLYSGVVNLLTDTDALLPLYLNACSFELEDVRVITQVIFPIRYLQVSNRVTDNEAGHAESDAFPPNVSGVFTLRGDYASRDNISTKHMPAVPLTAIALGIVNETQQSLYSAIAMYAKSQLLVEVGTNSITLVPIILKVANYLDSAVITNYQVPYTSRVMRRRTVGLGS
uniref:Uncharacterized protein n=1 Tax=uncultured prokaryote TaxID=198431 RepID=A0A0H5QN40_9ZZZZ|nr:hypothetical protein [uncultured prokaryote]